tara:strand:- start:65 stop:574 length:510 start_codon:yes stop_codon:yes gene_type:complete
MKLLGERLGVVEHFCPFAEQVNPILYSMILDLPNDPDHPDNVSGKMTTRDLFKYEKMNGFIAWITDILTNEFGKGGATHWSFPYDMRCRELWGVYYKKGDCITDHSHSPFLYAFSYYVKAPKGSPPLIFSTSGHRIKAETGKLVLFEGRLAHRVPKSKVNDRCIIGGCY